MITAANLGCYIEGIRYIETFGNFFGILLNQSKKSIFIFDIAEGNWKEAGDRLHIVLI